MDFDTFFGRGPEELGTVTFSTFLVILGARWDPNGVHFEEYEHFVWIQILNDFLSVRVCYDRKGRRQRRCPPEAFKILARA